MTIDLDAAIKTLEAHTPNDVICKKADLLGLIQRLREAEKDKARLDFMIEESCEIVHTMENRFYLAWRFESEAQAGTYKTARDAIDAAIDQQRKIATGEDLNL